MRRISFATARALLAAAVVVGSTPLPAVGQEPPTPNSQRGSFWVTEAGYAHSVTGLCADHYPSFEVGKLVNLEGPLAVGGTFFVGHNGDAVLGLLPRVRTWTSDEVALDFAGGPLFGSYRTRFTGYASLNYRDLLAGFVQYELDRDGGCGSGSENQIFFGVKLGSKPGIYAAAIGGAVAAVIIAVVISQVEN